MTILLLQIVLIALTFAFWNAYVIMWGVNSGNPHRKEWSKTWHMLGWIVRFQLSVLIAYCVWWLYGLDYIRILKWELVYLSVSFVLYDFIINLVRFTVLGMPPLFYVDNKGINKILLQIFGGETQFWVFKFLFIIGTVIYLAV